jgi:ABC-type transporter MlaC component
MLLRHRNILVLATMLLTAAAQANATPAQMDAEYEKQMVEYQQALVPQDAKIKIRAFHTAVKALDRNSIATSVCYPVRIMFRDKQIKLDNREAFLQHFDAVFTQRFNNTLAKVDWTPSVIGDKGITIGSGQIWFDMNGCVVTFNNNWYVM